MLIYKMLKKTTILHGGLCWHVVIILNLIDIFVVHYT